MTPEDLAAIHRACFRTPRPWTAAEFTDLLASPQCFLRSAPDGFALGRVIAGEAELLTIAVRPAARQRGIGRRLLEDFLAEAAQRGAISAFLEVSEANESALALYLKAGFALIARRHNYYRDPVASHDALILKRAVSATRVQGD